MHRYIYRWLIIYNFFKSSDDRKLGVKRLLSFRNTRFYPSHISIYLYIYIYMCVCVCVCECVCVWNAISLVQDLNSC